MEITEEKAGLDMLLQREKASNDIMLQQEKTKADIASKKAVAAATPKTQPKGK